MNFIQKMFGSREGQHQRNMNGYDVATGNPLIATFGDLFQLGGVQNNINNENIPTIHASIRAYCNAVSQCTPKVMTDIHGNIKRDTSSKVLELFRTPNHYETWSQFMFNIVGQMKLHGECFVVKSYQNGAVSSMHILPAKSSSAYMHEGEIYYALGINEVMRDALDFKYLAPQRDVIHFRQHTPRHPLIGESDLKAAGLAAGLQVSLNSNQLAFFNNMSRPSGTLETDLSLTKDQMGQLRSAFDNESTGWNSGKLPILSNGLKFKPLQLTAQDNQIIEQLRFSIEEIARCFQVPLPIIGDLSHATLANTQELINHWLSIGLGSLLENIEQTLTLGLDLPINSKIELDTAPLLRSDADSRVSALTKGVQGGIITPNEARGKEGLPPMDGGDEIFLQRQMVSVKAIEKLLENEMKPEPVPEVEPEPTIMDNEEELTKYLKGMVKK